MTTNEKIVCQLVTVAALIGIACWFNSTAANLQADLEEDLQKVIVNNIHKEIRMTKSYGRDIHTLRLIASRITDDINKLHNTKIKEPVLVEIPNSRVRITTPNGHFAIETAY